MARDIEEFLRKAAERRKQAQQGGGAPAPAPPPRQEQPRPAAPRPVAPRPAAPEARRPYTPPAAQQPPRRQEPVQAEVARSSKESVAQHVKSHINTSDIQEHVRQLGEEVGLADDKLEQRLHEKFDHSVGTLGNQARGAGDDSAVGLELLELLRNPRSLRQAILLSEILKRPEF